MRRTHFMPGQLVELNSTISEGQAQGYGLSCDDPRELLQPNKAYEVSGVDLRRWSTRIYLTGVEGSFNSMCFHSLE